MWHQVEHNYKTMFNEKYIFKIFYYTQIMINILVICFAQYKFQENKWCSGYNLPSPLTQMVQGSIPLLNFLFSP